ncbi:MAG: hypothetical protein M5U28_43405 [Sandaracinaceae bacterium]|nr:hypothetical protein [Sandaracinaceae bacterium]
MPMSFTRAIRRTYENLLPHSSEMELGEGLRCRVLSLEKVIEVKRSIGRPKDLAALPVLLATLDEIRRKATS